MPKRRVEKVRMPKKKFKKGNKVQRPFKGFSREAAIEIENIARRVAAQMFFPFENEMRRTNVEMDNIKANLVATTMVLESRQLVSKDEYMAAYNQFIADEIGIVEEDGTMHGRPVFSLYNIGE